MVVLSKQGGNTKGERRWHLLPQVVSFAVGALFTLTLTLNPAGRSSLSLSSQVETTGLRHKINVSDCNSQSSSAGDVDFSLAYDQSFGLLDDIPATTWKRMQWRFAEQDNFSNKKKSPMSLAKLPHMWYQLNFEANFACQNEVRVGGMGDGPKWVCNPLGIKRQAEQRKKESGEANGCLIYSIGSSGNFIFESGMQKEVGDCEVHIFDFFDFTGGMPPAIKDNAHFHPWGLKPSRGTFEPPENAKETDEFHSLQDIVEMLGHKGRTIDIFKIDCEGCEWDTYSDWLAAGVTMNQILVEVHEVPKNAIGLFLGLQNSGYVTFHKEPNTLGCRGDCIEYAFLRLHKEFFREYGFPKDTPPFMRANQ